MNKSNWAYGFALNHEGAGVGTIYYVEKYFDREGIVNPASAEAYTSTEINTIKENAKNGSANYITDVPEKAVVGMNPLHTDKIYWYDEDNSSKILKSANPLILNAQNGELKDADGKIVATAM